jgi:hypothetical protein
MAAAPVLPASPAPTPEPAPLSEGARILDTFIAPSKTFTDLRRNASWWAPWLLISIFSLTFMYAIGRQIGFEQVTRNQIAHSSKADQFDRLPPDQQAQRIQLSSKVIGFLSYGSPLTILFYMLVETVVLWVTFKVGTAAQTSFKSAYAISMYGALPSILAAILGTVALFAGVNPDGFDINNPVGSNLGYYLDPDATGKFIRAMASSLDLTSIWSIVLVGIGYSCTGKVKRATAIVIVAGWYLLFKLATSALAAM